MAASLRSPPPTDIIYSQHSLSHRYLRPCDFSISGSSEEDQPSPNHQWHSDDSDDDVPLAQSIPTALTAQKSIRKKVKEERVQRKQAREAAAGKLNGGTSQLRPLPGRSIEKAWSDAMKYAQQKPPQFHQPPPPQPAPVPQARQRSKSVSGGASKPPLSPTASASAHPIPPIPVTKTHSHSGNPSKETPIQRGRSLHNQRSFHHNHPEASSSAPIARQRSASVSRAHPPPRRDELIPPVPSRQQSEESRRPSTSSSGRDHATSPPPPTVHSPPTSRPPIESVMVDDKMIKALMSGNQEKVAELRRKQSLGSSKLKKTGGSLEPSSAPPPVPPIRSSATAEGSGQTRVFIGDMQRYQTLNVTPGMTAEDLIRFLEQQGVFKGWVGIGQWVVFEQVLDLGMERPLRPFEPLSSIISGWGKASGASGGALLVRMHDTYGVLLGASRIPDASPVWRGWVEWEVKRGKWQKRWLELKEHGIWVAKKDGAKPEPLCSLSAFDVYTLTPSSASSTIKQKAPKPYVFALKSVDSVTFFEDKSDYMHVFCCKEEEGDGWVESILLARSYILHQERNVLGSNHYHNHPHHGHHQNNHNKGDLNRRPTTGATLPHKRLVADPSHTNAVFEPGSLLRNVGGGI